MTRFVCHRDTFHNGKRYRRGQFWEHDGPPPKVDGLTWSIANLQAESDPGMDSVVTS